MTDFRERRGLARAPLDLTVAVEATNARHEARAINIGELGMRFVKAPGHLLAKGTEVLLEFTLPGDTEPFRLLGWVTADSDDPPAHGTSVTFAFHSDGEVERIRRYVSGFTPGLPVND